jgi:hypothetical protein
MFHRTLVHAAVVVCICVISVLTHLADAAESSLLRLDPALRFAKTPASSAPSETATTGGPASAEELAKKLSNPVSSLISVPLQSNFDESVRTTIDGNLAGH